MKLLERLAEAVVNQPWLKCLAASPCSDDVVEAIVLRVDACCKADDIHVAGHSALRVVAAERQEEDRYNWMMANEEANESAWQDSDEMNYIRNNGGDWIDD